VNVAAFASGSANPDFTEAHLEANPVSDPSDSDSSDSLVESEPIDGPSKLTVRHVSYIISVIGKVVGTIHFALETKGIDASIDTQAIKQPGWLQKLNSAGTVTREMSKKPESSIEALVEQHERERNAAKEKSLSIRTNSGGMANAAAVMQAIVKMTPGGISPRVSTESSSSKLASALSRARNRRSRDTTGSSMHGQTRSKSSLTAPHLPHSPGQAKQRGANASPVSRRIKNDITADASSRTNASFGAHSPTQGTGREWKIEQARSVLAAAVTAAASTSLLLKASNPNSARNALRRLTGKGTPGSKHPGKQRFAFGHHSPRSKLAALNTTRADARKSSAALQPLGSFRKSANSGASIA